MALHYVIGRVVTRSGTMRQETQWVERITSTQVRYTFRALLAKKFATQEEAAEAVGHLPADKKFTVRRAS